MCVAVPLYFCNMKKYIALSLLTIAVACGRPRALLTSYMSDPLGIDQNPTFSWQSSGPAQAGYEIQVFGEDGTQVWSSGLVEEPLSVQQPYTGPLAPETRYEWRVRTFDDSGRSTPWSRKASFETGISNWADAYWISSDALPISRYRSDFFLSSDLRIEGGRDTLQLSAGRRRTEGSVALLFGVRDSLTYVGVELTREGRLNLYHLRDGFRTEDASEDVSHLINGRISDAQHLEVEVYASQYCRRYNVNISLNGAPVTNSSKISSSELGPLEKLLSSGDKGEFKVDLSGGEMFAESRLYSIGLDGGGEASGIVIRDRAWGAELYKDALSRKVDGICFWEPAEGLSAPVFRKRFDATKRIAKARLYASSKGIYDCILNGKRVSDSYYNPGWAEYHKRLFYNVFDVTDLLRQGPNQFSVTLGQGWWSGFLGYQTNWQDQYGLRQAFLCKLVLTYSDGSTETIVSDSSWEKNDGGPILENSFQNGEMYDSRREAIAFGGGDGWAPVTLEAMSDSLCLQPYPGELIRCHEVREALSMTEPSPGLYIYDIGANVVGVPSVDLDLAEGQIVTLRYAEMLWPEEIPAEPTEPYTREMYEANAGTLYTDNYRSALSTDIVIGDGKVRTFVPRLTQHGFRYIQIEGLKAPLPLDKVRALVLHGMSSEKTASLETSNPLINKLFDNIVRGQEGNFLSVPTDCPQRDERLGYTGDGQVFGLAATYNYNVAPFFHRWLYSLRDNQLPSGSFPNYAPDLGRPGSLERTDGNIGWSDAGILVPWYLYCQYADKSILETSYESMVRYMDYLESLAQDYIMPFSGLGDWLAFERTNQQLIHTCFFALDAMAMAQIAESLGKDPSHYAQLYSHIKTAFNANFVAEDGRTIIRRGYDNGYLIFSSPVTEDTYIDTQASYALPLAVGLFDDPSRAASLLAQKVSTNADKLSTGFLSTPYLLSALSDNGYSDTAYDLLFQTECPSWLYPVTVGATTIWERWNSYTREHGFGPVDMNSFNHYSYGAVESWLFTSMLGIVAKEPGYKVFRFDPHPTDRLEYARGHFDTVYGRIEAGWTRTAEGFTYSVTVPANTTAYFRDILLPPGRHSFSL